MSEFPVKPVLPLAVALRYDAGRHEAPRVVAKGQGPIAERMVALAREHDVTIEANPHLAKALAGIDLDAEIPVELFGAVAEIIGFILRSRNRIVAHQPVETPQDIVDI